MARIFLLGVVLALSACNRTDYEGIPPPYYCEDLEEFGCASVNEGV